MPILPNTYKPGLEIRVEDLFSTNEPVKSALTIEAGHIYTKDAAGYIIEVPHTGTTSVTCDLRRGIFYALDDSRDETGSDVTEADGARFVPFAHLTSFVTLRADAGLTSGALVALKTQNQVGTPGQQSYVAPDVISDMVEAAPTGGAPASSGIVGRIYEIMKTRSRTDRRPPLVTAAGDRVAVRLGVI